MNREDGGSLRKRPFLLRSTPLAKEKRMLSQAKTEGGNMYTTLIYRIFVL